MKIYVILITILCVGVIGCVPADIKKQEYDKGYTEGYRVGYDEGVRDGKTDGRSIGYDQGYQAGKTNGIIEGEEKGKNKAYWQGYGRGTVAFFKKSWLPSLGLVITITLFILVITLLRRLLSQYLFRIKNFYDLKVRKSIARDDLARMIVASQTKELGSSTKGIPLKILENQKDYLHKLYQSKVMLNLKERSMQGDFEAEKKLNQCKISLSKAQSLIDEVFLILEHTGEERKINLMKAFLKILERDRSWPIETRLKIMDQIRNSSN